MDNTNRESADASTNASVNSSRASRGFNKKPSDIDPSTDCQLKVPVPLKRTDPATGETTKERVYKACGEKHCPVCGPTKRSQMWAHLRRNLKEKENLHWVGLTVDEKSVSPSDSREVIDGIWQSFYHRMRYRRREDADFEYFGIVEQEVGGLAHIHLLMSNPGVGEMDIRTDWYKSDGGIVAYVEPVETTKRLDQALGYVLKRHFEEARRAKSHDYRAPKPHVSKSLQFSSGKERKLRREMAQRKAAETQGVVSFRDREEYADWIQRYLSDDKDRSVNVRGHGEGVALEWENGQILVQLENGTVNEFSAEEVLPEEVDTVYFDQYNPETADKEESLGQEEFDNEESDREEPDRSSPDVNLDARSTEYVTTDDDNRVRVYWDEDAQRVRREVLSSREAHLGASASHLLDEYGKPLKPALPCPHESASFSPDRRIKPEKLVAPPDQEVKTDDSGSIEESEEVWKPVVGFEEYYSVSNKGNVRRNGREKPLKPWLDGSGYPVVSLSVEGEVTKHKIHHLVAKAFIGDPPGPIGLGSDDYQINHENGEKTDNRPENLTWMTHSENMAHAVKEGHLDNTGEKYGNSKLDWDKAPRIRALCEETDLTYKEIAERFEVSPSLIVKVIEEEIWKPENRPSGK